MNLSTQRLSLISMFIAAAAAGCGGGDATPAPSPAPAPAPAPSPTAQTINFTSPGAQTLGVTPAALSATASSNLAVTYTSTTPSVCTVSGTTLTLVALGECTVEANQSGDGTFAAAPAVSRTFTVGAPTSLTFASGYTNADADGVTFARAGRSVEGGSFNWYQDSTNNDWSNFWWNGISPLTDTPPSFYFGLGFNSSTSVPYIGAYVQAPTDGSVTLSGQTKMRIAVWGNDELTGRALPTFTVFAQLKESFAGCYVEVQAPVITPAAIGPQTYDLNLSEFTIKNNCQDSGVTTAAEALAKPIGAVHVQVQKANMYFDGANLSANGINFGPVSFEP